MRDTLFLIEPGFADPAFPGRVFYCWHCALLEGVLAGFPELGERIDVVRVAWPRPRRAVIEIAGEENQSLPLLVLGEGSGPGRLIADRHAILTMLHERHGFPEPHP